jgi:cell pole-organizing protein PopZ
MFGDKIEVMKRDFTDKYVLVDATRPELARFRDVVGRVKTVNMNGRALVEFDEYHLNVGWYDIAPEFLKVVDKPPPKEKKVEAKKPVAKPEAKLEAAKPAAPAAKAGKPSVAEMLAAARSGGAAKVGGAAPAPAKAKEALAAAKPAGAKGDRSKMSVADMLAAARSGGAAGAVPAAAKAAAPAAPAEEALAPVPAKKEAPAASKSIEKVDKSKMSIDDMVAWCREHDAK